MPRAIVYRRVSTDDQAESGAGLAAQIDACRAWCDREGYELIGPYDEDEGLSGSTPLDRCPALTEAVAELAAGDVLLVQKRDRVARDRIKIAMLEALLKRRKVRLVSAAGEGTELTAADDPMAFMYRGMTDLFAEFERLLIAWRTRSALAAKKRRNERTGRVPYGRDLHDDGRRSKSGGLPVALVVNPAEAETLEKLFALRRQGWSFQRIAWALNRQGIVTKAGKPWQSSSVAWVCSAHQVSKGHLDGYPEVTTATTAEH